MISDRLILSLCYKSFFRFKTFSLYNNKKTFFRLRQAFLDALEKQGSKKEKLASRTLKKSEKRARKEAKKAKKGKDKSMETFGYSDGFQFDIEEEYEEY